MPQEKTRNILFTVLLCSLAVIISSSYSDSNFKLNAYGQTPGQSTDPGAADNSTNSGSSLTDNSTNLASSLTDNSTNIDNMAAGPVNQTGLGMPNGTNNTSQTQSAIPEFGPVAQVVLVIAIFSMIIFRTKFSAFKN